VNEDRLRCSTIRLRCSRVNEGRVSFKERRKRLRSTAGGTTQNLTAMRVQAVEGILVDPGSACVGKVRVGKEGVRDRGGQGQLQLAHER
jgi:hypothetical protein